MSLIQAFYISEPPSIGTLNDIIRVYSINILVNIKNFIFARKYYMLRTSFLFLQILESQMLFKSFHSANTLFDI